MVTSHVISIFRITSRHKLLSKHVICGLGKILIAIAYCLVISAVKIQVDDTVERLLQGTFYT